jgi:hypothetical protein
MMLENMRTMVTALGGNSTALEGINPSDTYTLHPESRIGA